jgi:hypothetical protein
MPIPTPAISCGAIVSETVSRGRNARESTPAATRALPTIARGASSPGRRVPRKAASGSVETTAAAASGDSAQPEISSSTTRNKTPVNAAESSPRQRALSERSSLPTA